MAVRRMWKASGRILGKSITAVTIFSLVACAGTPEPILRSNAKVQLQGREVSKLDVAVCQQKAEAAGLKPGTGSRTGNMAAGASLGLVAGAAVGASRAAVDAGFAPNDRKRRLHPLTVRGAVGLLHSPSVGRRLGQQLCSKKRSFYWPRGARPSSGWRSWRARPGAGAGRTRSRHASWRNRSRQEPGWSTSPGKAPAPIEIEAGGVVVRLAGDSSAARVAEIAAALRASA